MLVFFIDSFIWQLVIVPILTIGTGVLIAIRVEKAYVAPLITLVLNLAIEMTMSLVYYETLHSPSSWNVLLPIPAFLIAYAFIGKRKTERHMENLS